MRGRGFRRSIRHLESVPPVPPERVGGRHAGEPVPDERPAFRVAGKHRAEEPAPAGRRSAMS